ncbi:hypothetical protein PQO03_20900 [Lentisphaera profundi]|uniref:Uncharacterized protein n=1 Tax=Lentisphaera profundi TaxID=1658616 RepID=A0ABY7W1X1_9BACT|nr:hypothetical protein [Lentisphaera profundi]WDE98278.1 hypothetical protein PQO03_20900 [Lentisphaera profundi]
MKKFILVLISLFIATSCNQIMIKEYQSPLDHEFFRSADCQEIKSGEYRYSQGEDHYILNSRTLKKFRSNELLWEKPREEILYPYEYLDLAVPYMLRDGMDTQEILHLLGKVDRSSNRFNYYKLSNGAELILFKGTLNMPKGMKSLTIQGLSFSDDFKLSPLKK